uniref:HEAT repeat domain-containing protein n=1 Tax=Schlesneria paludicola TaxID=360056 RepID=A0A7C2PGY4_9PLAN
MAVVLLLFVAWSAPPEEPVIAGETLTVWRERMNQIDPADPQSARWTPGLTAIVETESLPWFTRRQAALTLGRMGLLAADAVPVMRRHLNDVGDPPDAGPQLWALKALALFGPVARDAAPDVARVLKSPSTPALSRLTAVDALSQIGPGHPVVIPTLIAFAGDQSAPDLRRAAIEALGMSGPAAASALPVLVRALDDSDENVRREAATSLGKLGPNGEPAQFALLERLAIDEIPAVQDAAATALAAIGPVVGPQLLPLLESDDAETRRRVVTILGTWRASSRLWVMAVQSRWDDPSPAVRLAALEAAWQITARGEPIARRIAAELTVDDRQLRIAAVRLLARLGAEAKSAEPVLRELLQHDRTDVRLAVEKALEVIDE